jgi:hypothetical protein
MPSVSLTESKRPSNRLAFAPSSQGFVISPSSFRMTPNAQRITDQDGTNSVRVEGNDIFASAIIAGSSDATAGFGSTANFSRALRPSAVSIRLQTFESLYSYYAFRRVKFIYNPQVGTSTAVNLALSYSPNPADASDGTLTVVTQTEAMEMPCGVMTPVWSPASFEMKFTGTKLYVTTSTTQSTTLIDYAQGALFAVLGGTPVSSTQYGLISVEYVIDFYGNTPPLTTPSLKAREKREEKKCEIKVTDETPSPIKASRFTSNTSVLGGSEIADQAYVVLKSGDLVSESHFLKDRMAIRNADPSPQKK